MIFTKYHIYYIFSCIISSFVPIVYKEYKKYPVAIILCYLLSINIGGMLYILYNSNTDTLKEKMILSFSKKNIFTSFIAELQIILKQLAVKILPLSILAPTFNLWLGSSMFFGKIINNEKPSKYQIASVIIIIIGSFILNIKKDIKYNNAYNIGLVFLLLAVLLSGYNVSVFKNISTKTQDPGYTMLIQSSGSLLLLLFIYLIDKLFFHKISLPSFTILFKLFILFMIILNSYIFLLYTSLSNIKQLDTLCLSQIKVVIPVLVGILYYKESVNLSKVLGLIIIGFGVLCGMK